MASVDIPAVVQKNRPQDPVRAVTVQEAQALYLKEIEELDAMRKIIHQPCKEVLDCRLVAKKTEEII